MGTHTPEQSRRYQDRIRACKIDGATLASRMPRRRCTACKGSRTLAPGGNERHRRVCGQCLGRGYHFIGKEAPRGTWFEGHGERPLYEHHGNSTFESRRGLTS